MYQATPTKLSEIRQLTDSQRLLLKNNTKDNCKQAAIVIASADVLIFLTGAGWSKESGLPLYPDIMGEHPLYQASQAKAKSVSDMLDGESETAEAFYGFWGSRFNEHRNTTPHAGYAIVKKWRDRYFSISSNLDPDSENLSNRLAARARAIKRQKELVASAAKNGGGFDLGVFAEPPPAAGAFFTYTSNIDAHHLRVFEPCEVRECFGNTEYWQCNDKECLQTHDRKCLAPGNFCFEVDEDMLVSNTTSTRTFVDSESVSFATNHPMCTACGGSARPCALLQKGDKTWLDDTAQQKRWNAWTCGLFAELAAFISISEVKKSLSVVLLEVGAGRGAVGADGSTEPEIRTQSEALLTYIEKSGGAATLVRVNPNIPFADSPSSQSKTISLMLDGLEALQEIDSMLESIERPRSRLTVREKRSASHIPVEEIEAVLGLVNIEEAKEAVGLI